MVNDIIGDTLTRIRNAHTRRMDSVIVLRGKVVKEVLKVLTTEKFINGFEEVKDDEEQDVYRVDIRYINKEPAMYSIKRISKPGLRKYIGYKDLRKIKSGIGIQILSTSKGLMTATDARQNKVGGEILC